MFIVKIELVSEDIFGTMSVEPRGEHVAGTYMSLVLTYTAGIYGMDDLGGLKILFRYACDQSPLQMSDPKGLGYTTATASNGANIELIYAIREGERPWYKMLRVRIAGAGLKEGETITIHLGDSRFGSPGIRLQTFVEPRFEFRTLVDVYSTNVFKLIPSPEISLVSGNPVKWRAFLPTLRKIDDKFSLQVRAEDKWGNPSNKVEGTFFLKSSIPENGLPESFEWPKGSPIHIIDNLSLVKEQTERIALKIKVLNEEETVLTTTNPLVMDPKPPFLHFWGDLHGQSEETIGSNTARRYFEFARDRAFLDVMGHQGNDFQITKEFWQTLNQLSEEFNDPGKFITLCGYEYSANTALGGDRNVYFLHPYRQIHRSSHELIPEEDDRDTDCFTASDLFKALIADNPDADDGVIVFAHAGGRYSDIRNHHDGRVESSVEIHSSWGTFEWLLHDAFDMGYRVGIVANGDGHRGRPGLTYPGTSKFGALGGFTCFLTSELTREAIFKALKRRRHYATTGERIYLDVQAKLNFEGKLFKRDPAVYPIKEIRSVTCKTANMGDIIQVPVGNSEKIELKLKIAVNANAPIERIEIFNGLDLVETIKPCLEESNSNEILERIRIIWEGAEFRARRRNVNWKGTATFTNNQVKEVSSFNFWNVDAPLRQDSPNQVSWDTMTSGNFQGFDVILTDSLSGRLMFKSSQIAFELPISSITQEDTVIKAGGLGKRVRIFRLPLKNDCSSFNVEKTLKLKPVPEKDERIYVKVTLENGHLAWSSPMYFIS